MSYMHDINGNKEQLQRQIKYLEQNEQIDKEIEQSRCPICGGKLELVIHRGGGDSIVTPFVGIVRCTRCDMFEKRIERTAHESYHWKYDGSDEIALKREVWSLVKRYIKRV